MAEYFLLPVTSLVFSISCLLDHLSDWPISICDNAARRSGQFLALSLGVQHQ